MTKRKTRINKSIALIAHSYAYIISTTTADSGNEANSNSFIVLFSDISGFRVNDLQ